MVNSSNDEWDAEVDIVIGGAGAAGLAAAIAAAEAGLETFVFEKKEKVSETTTALSSGGLSFAGTDMQEAEGIQDSNDLFYEDIVRTGNRVNDPKLVQAYVDNQLETYYWLKGLGVKFNKPGIGGGMTVPRMHDVDPVELVNIMSIAARQKGVSILFNAPIIDLITDEDGRVVGVTVEESDGSITRVKGRKGVILATGGFTRDIERLKAIDPRFDKVIAITGKGCTGDGHTMAVKLGAYEKDTEYVKPTFGLHADGTSVSDLLLLYYKGGIIVNKNGERYVNESISYKDIAMATLDQPDFIGYQLFDKNIYDKGVADSKEAAKTIPVESFAEGLDPGRIGMTLKADTIEELASQMDVPAEALKTTVEKYNSYVDAGKDPEFGRESLAGNFGKIQKIVDPPFYAYKSVGTFLASYAGIVVDEYGQVLTKDGKIPGLYALGETIGGFHGQAYHSGTSINKGIVFGRIAIKKIASSQE